MKRYDTADLILLYLHGQAADTTPRAGGESATGGEGPGTDRGRETADEGGRPAASPRELADALITDPSISRRVELLSTLSTLAREGHVEEVRRADDGTTAGHRGDGTVYRLTASGSERAAALYESLADERIRVEDGGASEVPLREVDRYLPDPAVPRALSRVTDEGVLYLEEHFEERFVDRSVELGRLQAARERVAERGSAGVALVEGAPGMGKTTLLSKFADQVVDAGDQVLVGREYDPNEPFGAVRSALASLFEGETPFETDASDPEDPEGFRAGRTAMFEAVVEALSTATDDGPVALVLDDLHTAGTATFELLGHVLDYLDGPVLVVGAYRDEAVDGDHPLAHFREQYDPAHVELGAFDRSATRDFVEWLLGTRTVPSDFVDAVYEHTGGYPLFVEESVTALREAGEVRPGDEFYPTSPAEVPLPDRVEQTVRSRLEPLDETALTPLYLGAIVGQTVPLDVLRVAIDRHAASGDLDPARESDYVDLLLDARIWERVAGDTIEFKSGVVRDAVLESIPDGKLAALHRSVAEAYRDAGRSGPGHHLTVATHFERAGDPEAAFEHYERAGAAAEDRFAHETAVDAYEAALELAREDLALEDDDDAVLELLRDVGNVHRILGEFEAATRYFEFVWNRASDPDLKAAAAGRIANVHGQSGAFEAAIEWTERGLDVLPGNDPSEAACRLRAERGWTSLRTGEFDRAATDFEALRADAAALDDDSLVGEADHLLGTLRMHRGELPDAVDAFERAIDRREAAGDTRGRARSLANLGVSHLNRGEIAAAEPRLEEALELHEEIADPHGQMSVLNNLAAIYEQRGEIAAALEAFEQCREWAEKLDAGENEPMFAANAGLMRFYRGETGRARDLVESAVADLESLGVERLIARVRGGVLARILLFQGDLDAATERAERELDRAEDLGARRVGVIVRTVLGRVHRHAGDPEAAIEYHERAHRTAEEYDLGSRSELEFHLVLDHLEAGHDAERIDDVLESGAPADETDVRLSAIGNAVRGRAGAATGDRELAERAFERATEAAREFGSPPYRAMVHYHHARALAGDDAAAADHVERARSIAADHDLGLFLDRTAELRDGIDG